MENQLSPSDIEVILEALKYSKMKYEQTKYPDEDFRQKQVERLENAERKLRDLQSAMISE